MTATSQPRSPADKRPLRFGLMESLGFYEQGMTRSVTSGYQLSPTHGETAPDSGRTVDPFDDWQPSEVGRRLVTGRVRWTALLGVLMMCAGIAGIAAWLYQRPVELARDAQAELKTTASALEPALLALQPANDLLVSSLDQTGSHTEALLESDARARALYEASANLSRTAAAHRSRAADAASAALEATRILREALAYRAGIATILTMPEMQTDPGLIELDEAARAFGEWQSHFDAVRTALPDRTLAPVTAELASISATIHTSQTLYLDALRTDDPGAAQAVLDSLTARLESAQAILNAELAKIHATVATRIDAGLAAIASLVG